MNTLEETVTNKEIKDPKWIKTHFEPKPKYACSKLQYSNEVLILKKVKNKKDKDPEIILETDLGEKVNCNASWITKYWQPSVYPQQ